MSNQDSMFYRVQSLVRKEVLVQLAELYPLRSYDHMSGLSFDQFIQDLIASEELSAMSVISVFNAVHHALLDVINPEMINARVFNESWKKSSENTTRPAPPPAPQPLGVATASEQTTDSSVATSTTPQESDETSPLVLARNNRLRDAIIRTLKKVWPKEHFVQMETLPLNTVVRDALMLRFLDTDSLSSVMFSIGFNCKERLEFVAESLANRANYTTFPVMSARLPEQKYFSRVFLVDRKMTGEQELILVFNESGIGTAEVVSDGCYNAFCVVQEWVSFTSDFLEGFPDQIRARDWFKKFSSQVKFGETTFECCWDDIYEKILSLNSKESGTSRQVNQPT